MTAFAPTSLSRPYQILFEHRPGYLYVLIRCETTNYTIAKKYWAEILEMQLRRGYERVLIDKDVANSMPTHDVIMLVTELSHLGCHDVKFAIYDRNYDVDRCGFEEMVGTNRGLKVRICGAVDEALAWLAGPLPHEPRRGAGGHRFASLQ
jgi:hypothetical protein